MRCVSCGRVQKLHKCHRCWLVENLNREYLKQMNDGNYKEAKNIAEEVVYVQQSPAVKFNRRLYVDKDCNVFCLTYRQINSHVPLYGSNEVLTTERQKLLDQGLVECSGGAFSAICKHQVRM